MFSGEGVMNYLLGIDLGTTGVKALLVDEKGRVVDSSVRNYPLLVPRPGWAEQDPEEWEKASFQALRDLTERHEGERILAIGLTGQMHGAVLLDAGGEVIRPPILWCDQRTVEESEEIHRIFGYERFLEITGNPALTGFTAPKILWVRKKEPDNFRRLRKILLPKDYLRYLLTGELITDVTDASGTSLFEVVNRRWSKEVLKGLGLKEDNLPPVQESPEISGRVTREAAKKTGLKEGTPVVSGAGDQAASAFGCGIIREGLISVTLGTSGVVFASLDKFRREERGRLHAFCHAVRGKWHLMGVILSAGGSLRWFRDVLGREEIREAAEKGIDPYTLLTEKASSIPPGSEGVLFLPYLAGERTPHQDPFARGVFFGISLKTQKGHLTRCILEGISYGLKDSLELMRNLGVKIEEVRLVGGGARSSLWRRILAGVFQLPLYTLEVEEGSSYGAALLAGVGGGVFSDEEEASRAVKIKDKIEPLEKEAEIYGKIYPLFKELYASLRDKFRQLGELEIG